MKNKTPKTTFSRAIFSISQDAKLSEEHNTEHLMVKVMQPVADSPVFVIKTDSDGWSFDDLGEIFALLGKLVKLGEGIVQATDSALENSQVAGPTCEKSIKKGEKRIPLIVSENTDVSKQLISIYARLNSIIENFDLDRFSEKEIKKMLNAEAAIIKALHTTLAQVNKYLLQP